METEYVGFGVVLTVFMAGGGVLWFLNLERVETVAGAVISGLALLVISLVAAFGFADALYSINYGSGQRVGLVVKVSKSGLFWDTTEGSLMIGQTRDSVWDFTVPESLASQLSDLDAGKKMVIEYDEAFMAVPWEGRSRYRMTKAHVAE